jgi:hypothetical protein
VRDLDLTVAGGEQPGVGQRRQHRFGSIDSLELSKRQAATDKRAVLAVREPQQEAARDPTPVRIEPYIGVLGEPSDRSPDAAARRVALDAQHAPVARPPQLEQHRRQQRQPTGLPGHVGDQIVDQCSLDVQPRRLSMTRSILFRIVGVVAVTSQ